MDRRKFLEASALLGGAMLVKPELAVASSNQKAKLSADLDVKSYVKEPKRLIPVIDTADVVILGGGPAGVSAAVSAARYGADVILLEKQYYLGGLWTGCL
jgi:NADPH-dependent 2,4-dienoyl-CoA reductase/sulfur reductase-like enzyme